MRIEEDIKLDFKDVLIRPKRSTLGSRKEVDIRRKFTFKWSGREFDGVPIVSANMDGVGTFEMARAFHNDGNGLSVAITKHYSKDQLVEFLNNDPAASNMWYSIGVAERDKEKLDAVMKEAPGKIDKV